MGDIQISNTEWEVMKLLWKESPQTSRELHAYLARGQGWSTKTVRTLLFRLTAKGAVEHRPKGRGYEYYPAVTQNEIMHRERRGFLKKVYDGAAKPLIAGFIEETELSPEEIEELMALLKQKKQERL